MYRLCLSKKMTRPVLCDPFLQHILTHREYRLVRPGVLTVSAYPQFYPICYFTKQHKLAGLDVDLIKTFAKWSKLRIKFRIHRRFRGIWNAPAQGKSDVSIGGIGITPDRTRAQTAWTIPYFYVQRTAIYNPKVYDPTRSTKAPVFGTWPKSTVMRATFGSTGQLDWKARKIPGTLQNGKSDEEDIRDLLDGKVQGVMRGSFVAKAILRRHPSLKMVRPWDITPSIVSKDGEVFAFPTWIHSGLAQTLSAFIVGIQTSGLLARLLEKHKVTF